MNKIMKVWKPDPDLFGCFIVEEVEDVEDNTTTESINSGLKEEER